MDPTVPTPEAFDAQFRAQADSALLAGIWAEAWGDDYPLEAAPFSACTWPVLGAAAASLRPPHGGVLVDMGCGLGGPGMWLARATATRLIGVDWSAAAVEIARGRSGAWLPADRVDVRVGTLEDTGLPAGCADAVVSMDALPLVSDPEAAAAEAARLLRPGGRLAFTAAAPAEGACPWTGLLRAAGLQPGPGVELPGLSDGWRRLYAAFREQADALRADLGDTAADTLLAEADAIGPMLDGLRWRLVEASAPR